MENIADIATNKPETMTVQQIHDAERTFESFNASAGSKGKETSGSVSEHAVECVGTDEDAFRVYYHPDNGLVVDWEESSLPILADGPKMLPVLLPRAVSAASAFALYGAVDIFTGNAGIIYYPGFTVGTLAASVFIGHNDWKKAQRKASLHTPEEPKIEITSQMLSRGDEFDHAIHIDSAPVRLSLSDTSTPKSFGREYQISAKDFLSLLKEDLFGFNNYDAHVWSCGIYTVHLPRSEKEERSKLPASNKSEDEHFVVIKNPAAVLFQILKDPVTTDGHDEGVSLLLGDLLDIAVAQKGLMEINAEEKYVKELSLGGSTAAEKLRQAKIEEQKSASQTTQADIAKRVLDCVADYLVRKDKNFRSVQYGDLAKLSRVMIESGTDETTPILRAAFDEAALRVIGGLSTSGVMTDWQADPVSKDMHELALIAKQGE